MAASQQMDVLIVDDSVVVRRILSKALADDGRFHVAGAVSNGEQALRFIADQPVDLVLLDWNMPIMSGLDFLKELSLLKLVRPPKVIFCTTENGVDHIRAAVDAGADEYVMKPFDRDTLESKLQIVGVL